MSGRARLEAMSEADLEWIEVHERDLHVSPWTRGNFVDALKAGYIARVLRIDDEVVGYAVMMCVLDETHLLNISVLHAHQNRGVGRALLDMLIKISHEHGANQMFLEVRPSNAPALALYKRTGFTLVGRRSNYYPAENGREDALLMRLAL